MNPRLLMLIVATVAVLGACSSIESRWYRCDSGRWSGWEYQDECTRLRQARSLNGLV